MDYLLQTDYLSIIFFVIVAVVILLYLRRRFRQIDENPEGEREFREKVAEGERALLEGRLRDPGRFYNSVKWLFIILSAGTIINGLFQIYYVLSGDILVLSARDAIFNTSFGIIYLICLWFYIKRNKIVLWVFGVGILISTAYSFTVGRGFNYFMVIFGAIILYQLVLLVKANELV